jgi:glycine C-acetyltransferase
MYAMKVDQPDVRKASRADLSLRNALIEGRHQHLQERVRSFSGLLGRQSKYSKALFMRKVVSAADREVVVVDPFTGRLKKMLMFGSNNYLGLANHPYVRERVTRTVDEFGIGVGGPPLLNGYTGLHRQLEERLAALKGVEDAILFPTGYSANVGLISGLTQPDDGIVYDALSHASFRDGLHLTQAAHAEFGHNRLDELERQIDRFRVERQDVFVGVEGVYSMDGDLAPLDEISEICQRKGSILLVDDAHGTGVMGPMGKGTASHFGVEGQVDVTMGTFSKVFSVTGGFVAASKPITSYLRYFARSHMFSASLPPMVVAAVVAGLEVMEFEPERLDRLRGNIRYVSKRLKNKGIEAEMSSPILALRVPVGADMFASARKLHEAGLFINPVVFPAVPANQQRFRISLMADHTRDDLDRLVSCVSEIVADWERNDQMEALK